MFDRTAVLAAIKPSPEEKKKAAQVAQKECDRLHKLLGVPIVMGGSLAKNTWLKHNHDIDFFACFSKEIDLSPLDAFAQKVHGSREYYQYETDGFQIEVVPVKKITSYKQAENVTDMSPLHVVFANDHLTSRMCDDVRLLKKFCKAQRVYGAESYINGFSGHVLELLTIYYGSFQKLMRAASCWQAPVVIDIQEYHAEPLAAINTSKHAPIILVDPVQPDRNAAAALSTKSFERFVLAAKKFVTEPKNSAFTKKPFRIPKGAYVLEFVSLDGKKDTSGTKALKAFSHITKNLKEFVVEKSDFTYDHEKHLARAYVKTQKVRLSKYYEHKGPPTHVKTAKDFLHKHKDAFEKEGVLYVTLEREHKTLHAKISSLLKDSAVTSRVVRARGKQQ